MASVSGARQLPDHFHDGIRAWFEGSFVEPTQTQLDAWQAISAGNHALVAAPTGSGKTLSAFLSAINDLVHHAQAGTLANEVKVIYVSPLKALSNDINHNLQGPLDGITQYYCENVSQDLEDQGETVMPIRAAVRTGDTSASERARMIKAPPHILVPLPRPSIFY